MEEAPPLSQLFSRNDPSSQTTIAIENEDKPEIKQSHYPINDEFNRTEKYIYNNTAIGSFITENNNRTNKKYVKIKKKTNKQTK